MMYRDLLRVMQPAAVVALVLIVAACSGPADPLRASAEASPSEAVEASGDDEAWNYVALGTSFTGYASWPEMYVAHIEKDLGVEVRLHDETVGGGRADEALERIRSDEPLRALLAQADVITVDPAIDEMRVPMVTFAGEGGCGGVDGQDCFRETLPGVKAAWEGLLDELVELRSPSQADLIVIVPGAWLAEYACGSWGSACWEVEAGYVVELLRFWSEAAAERGLKVANTLEALHGPGVFEAPVDRDYLQSDRLHLTDAASQIIADLLRELGYTPL